MRPTRGVDGHAQRSTCVEQALVIAGQLDGAAVAPAGTRSTRDAAHRACAAGPGNGSSARASTGGTSSRNASRVVTWRIEFAVRSRQPQRVDPRPGSGTRAADLPTSDSRHSFAGGTRSSASRLRERDGRVEVDHRLVPVRLEVTQDRRQLRNRLPRWLGRRHLRGRPKPALPDRVGQQRVRQHRTAIHTPGGTSSATTRSRSVTSTASPLAARRTYSDEPVLQHLEPHGAHHAQCSFRKLLLASSGPRLSVMAKTSMRGSCRPARARLTCAVFDGRVRRICDPRVSAALRPLVSGRPSLRARDPPRLH